MNDPIKPKLNFDLSKALLMQGSHIMLENGRTTKVLVVTDNAFICTQEDLGLGVCGWADGCWADWVKDACRTAGVPETQGIRLLYKSEVTAYGQHHRLDSTGSMRSIPPLKITLEKIQ